MTIEFKDYEQGLDPFIVHCAYANCDMTVDTSDYDNDPSAAQDIVLDDGWVDIEGRAAFFCPKHAAVAQFPWKLIREAGHFSIADFARLHAAVYGQAVGDALGVPYEFQHRGTFECTGMIGHGTHNQPAGTWSDDTAMMLATLDSLAEHGGRVDTDDMLAKYRAWAKSGEYTPDGTVFDIGTTTSHALASGHGGTDEYDNGNGSLMRILPLAFTDCSDDDIRRVSAITHAHRISTDICVRFIRIARLLLAEGTAYSRTEVCKIANIPEDLRFCERRRIKSGTFVLDTMLSAVWCLVNTDNYRDCVLAAVNLGGDTDTTAAVAGGLAGLLYGDEGNPWEEEMRGTELLETLIAKAALNLPGLHPRAWEVTAFQKAEKTARDEEEGLRQLIALVPRFEQAQEEGRRLYDNSHLSEEVDGKTIFRGVSYDPLIDEWWEAVYKAWGDRGDYHEYLENLNLDNPRDLADFYRDRDFDNLDLDSTLTLLLFPTREERFCDGALCDYLDDGSILYLMHHLRDLQGGNDI